MNIQTFKSVLSACQEADSSCEINLTKGERYLITNVFIPFYLDEEQTTTDNLDFSAFSKEELSYVYSNIEELVPWFQNIADYMAMTDFLAKAKRACQMLCLFEVPVCLNILIMKFCI